MTTFPKVKWTIHKTGKWACLGGDENKVVFIVPKPKFMWVFDRVFDYADTVEDAMDMIEGLYVIEHGAIDFDRSAVKNAQLS